MTTTNSKMAAGLSRVAALLGIAALLALAPGCGGLPADNTPDEPRGTVVVIVVEEGTNAPLPVPATVIVGGVRGVQGPNDEQVVLRNVPEGTGSPPTQPMTVSAARYVTTATQTALNVTTATWVQVTVTPADTSTTGTVEGIVKAFGEAGGVVNAFLQFKIVGNPDAEGVSGFTDSEGRFIIGGIPMGANDLVVQAADFLEHSERVVVIADDDDRTPDVEIVLIAGDTRINVRGRVLDVLTRSPIVDATVTVGGKPPVTTAADGHFVVEEVLVGARALEVTHPTHDPYQADILVMPGMTDLVIELFEAAQDPPGSPRTIAGRVTLTGAPDNSGALVTATRIGEATPLDADTTDAAGRYGLFVPPGRYRVTVTWRGSQLSRNVTVPTGGVVVSGVNFAMSGG